VTTDRLKVRDYLVARDTFMLGDGAKDRTQCSESEGMVVWNRDPVVRWLAGF
jgi:hypothetical protein